jgi:hypothetical protein
LLLFRALRLVYALWIECGHGLEGAVDAVTTFKISEQPGAHVQQSVGFVFLGSQHLTNATFERLGESS